MPDSTLAQLIVILLAWSLLTLGTAVVGLYAQPSERWRGFWFMSGLWGLVDGLIVVYVLLRPTVSAAELESILKINFALDWLYLLIGIVLMTRTRPLIQGFGVAILMHAVFLLTLDGTFLMLVKKPIEPVPAAGLHNVFRLSDQLYSGSSPEGEAGFASLQALGVKTIISVDGARPNLELARKYGLRYVHVPVGYDGIPAAKQLLLARAAQELPGPVYVHCHHGKHRGPAAAVCLQYVLEPSFTAEEARDWLHKAGTDPRYTGLFTVAESAIRPDSAELARVPAEFPSEAAVASLTRLMVEVDARWTRLKEAKAANWQDPDAAHDALQLLELYREIARLPELTGRKNAEDFRKHLQDAESQAMALEQALRSKPVNETAAKAAFEQSQSLCHRCHTRHRD